jgi:hypothetical protein
MSMDPMSNDKKVDTVIRLLEMVKASEWRGFSRRCEKLMKDSGIHGWAKVRAAEMWDFWSSKV